MDRTQLKSLLEQVRSGDVEIDLALDRLKHMPFEDLGFAKVDHHRALRHGMPEVVFGKGKTPEQIAAIAEQLLERAPNVLITRADAAGLGRDARHVPGRRVLPAFARGSRVARPDGSWHAERSRSSAPGRATCSWPKRP